MSLRANSGRWPDRRCSTAVIFQPHPSELDQRGLFNDVAASRWIRELGRRLVREYFSENEVEVFHNGSVVSKAETTYWHPVRSSDRLSGIAWWGKAMRSQVRMLYAFNGYNSNGELVPFLTGWQIRTFIHPITYRAVRIPSEIRIKLASLSPTDGDRS